MLAIAFLALLGTAATDALTDCRSQTGAFRVSVTNQNIEAVSGDASCAHSDRERDLVNRAEEVGSRIRWSANLRPSAYSGTRPRLLPEAVLADMIVAGELSRYAELEGQLPTGYRAYLRITPHSVASVTRAYAFSEDLSVRCEFYTWDAVAHRPSHARDTSALVCSVRNSDFTAGFSLPSGLSREVGWLAELVSDRVADIAAPDGSCRVNYSVRAEGPNVSDIQCTTDLDPDGLEEAARSAFSWSPGDQFSEWMAGRLDLEFDWQDERWALRPELLYAPMDQLYPDGLSRGHAFACRVHYTIRDHRAENICVDCNSTAYEAALEAMMTERVEQSFFTNADPDLQYVLTADHAFSLGGVTRDIPPFPEPDRCEAGR